MANINCLLVLVIVSFNFTLITGATPANSTNKRAQGRPYSYETRIWEVGLDLMTALRNGIWTESPMFFIMNKTVEQRWFLRLLPNAFKPEDNGNVSLFLVSRNNFETQPTIDVSILNKEPSKTITAKPAYIYPKFASFGWTHFTLLRTLLDPEQGFIFDDKIRFRVRFVTDSMPLHVPSAHETRAFYWAVGLKTMNLPKGIATNSHKLHTWASNGDPVTWVLRLAPNGYTPKNRNSTRTLLYVYYYGDTPYSADMELFVKNIKMENTFRKHIHGTMNQYGETVELTDFIDRDTLIDPKSGFVHQDEIIFGVRIPSYNEHLVRAEQETVTYTWDVGLESFNLASTANDEIALESPKFVAWNQQKKEGWFLRMYPNGYKYENNGFVSLYLVYDGNHTVLPFAKVFIVNQDPRNALRTWSLREYNVHLESYGWHKMIPRKYLLDPSNGFVIDDKIKFGVQLRTDRFLQELESPMITNFWEIEVETLMGNAHEKIESEVFEIEIRNTTETWYLEMYPHGKQFSDTGFVSLDLVSINDGPTYAEVEVFLSNKKSENTIRKWSHGLYDSPTTRGWRKVIKFSDLIDEKNGFVFENETKFIEVGFGMPLELEEEEEVEPHEADPDPVIVPESLKVKLRSIQSTTTTTTTTPSPPSTSSSPPLETPTPTLLPYQIEAVASNLL